MAVRSAWRSPFPGVRVVWTPIALTAPEPWRSAGRASLRRPLIRLPKRAVLRIRVESGVTPTGEVKVFAQGKRRPRTVATAVLRRNDAGRTTVRLSRLAGRQRIWFQYAGEASTQGSRSNPTCLTVTKR